jgi:hypothetical protein
MNIFLESFRLVQNRNKYTKCDFKRITESLISNNDCVRKNSLDQETWIVGNQTFPFLTNSSGIEMKEMFGNYEDSGYISDVTMTFPEFFYEDMNNLINIDWVDEKTSSIILIFNFYNPSSELLISYRILFENITGLFKNVFSKYYLLDISKSSDIYLVFSFIFSIMFLINFIFLLKISPANETDSEDIRLIHKGSCRKLREIFRNSLIYIKKNFRAPDFYECLSNYILFIHYKALFTIFLYYIALIIRSTNSSKTIQIVIEKDFFTDFGKYNYNLDQITNFNCIVILLLFFGGIMMHLTQISEDLKIIADSLIDVIYN